MPPATASSTKERIDRRKRATSRTESVVVSIARPSDMPRFRFTHREAQHQGEDHTREADDEEGDPPVEEFDDPAARQVAEHDPDRDADVVEGEGRGALVWWKVVRDQGMRRRAPGSLPDADSDACDRQLEEVLGEAAGRRHEAPGRESDRDDRSPHTLVGPACDRDTKAGVEDGEGEAGQETHLGIGGAQVFFDRIEQNREDLPIDEVEDVDDEQDREHVA